MIIHAIANLQSTYATSATLTITASRGLPLTLGIGDHVQSGHKDLSEPKTVFTVPLRSLLYGQPRDIVFSYDNRPFMPKSGAPLLKGLLERGPSRATFNTWFVFRRVWRSTTVTASVFAVFLGRWPHFRRMEKEHRLWMSEGNEDSWKA